MRMLKVAIVVASMSIAGVALACPDKDKKAEVAEIAVNDAASMSKKGQIIMVDANSKRTREKEGVVPGARLLTSYRDFDVKELKASKKDTLVFYCYSEACGAAPAAAKTARAKGFKTKVMSAGIIGWKKAGHPVSKI